MTKNTYFASLLIATCKIIFGENHPPGEIITEFQKHRESKITKKWEK
jgi:hypothetical protein